MSLGFINGAYNLATGTLAAFGALSDDLVREGHPAMVSRSGDREPQTQINLFLSRYRKQSTGTGPYGDVKWWQGVRYVRYSSAGTVAVPGNSNHERRRANDLTYPYNSTGTAAHKRARVLAARHNITCEGLNFREPWHWTFWGDLGTINLPAGGQTTTSDPAPEPEEEDDDMALIISYTDPGDEKRNGIWGCFGGSVKKFTAEQWAQARTRAPWAGAEIVEFKPTGKAGDATPRAFDVYKSTLAAGGVSTAQVQQIADAVLAKIGTPTVTIDYQAIADAVNDDAAKRMAD